MVGVFKLWQVVEHVGRLLVILPLALLKVLVIIVEHVYLWLLPFPLVCSILKHLLCHELDAGGRARRRRAAALDAAHK